MLVIGLGQNTQKYLKHFRCDVELVDVEIQDSFEKTENLFTPSFQNLPNEIIFLMESWNQSSLASLKCLEFFFNNEIKVNCILICPENSLLSNQDIQIHNLVKGVLCEKARSNRIKELCLIDLDLINKFVTEYSLLEYEEKLNSFITNSYTHYTESLTNKPLLEKGSDIHETAKIMTLSLCELDSVSIHTFYDLKMPRDFRFYFLLSNNSLKQKDILNRIKTLNNSFKKKDNTIGYKVFETPFEEDYIYCSLHSSYTKQ